MTSAFEKIPPAKLEAKIYGFLEREKLMPTGDGMTTSKICGNHNIHPLFIDKKTRKVYCIFAIDRITKPLRCRCEILVQRFKVQGYSPRHEQ